MFVVFEQAQQLFQRDAQTITPEALESVKAALASSEIEHKAETKKKALPRKAAGHSWEDPTLAEWPESMNRVALLLFQRIILTPSLFFDEDFTPHAFTRKIVNVTVSFPILFSWMRLLCISIVLAFCR